MINYVHHQKLLVCQSLIGEWGTGLNFRSLVDVPASALVDWMMLRSF